MNWEFIVSTILAAGFGITALVLAVKRAERRR
jgi:hypothetical protein